MFAIVRSGATTLASDSIKLNSSEKQKNYAFKNYELKKLAPPQARACNYYFYDYDVYDLSFFLLS